MEGAGVQLSTECTHSGVNFAKTGPHTQQLTGLLKFSANMLSQGTPLRKPQFHWDLPERWRPWRPGPPWPSPRRGPQACTQSPALPHLEAPWHKLSIFENWPQEIETNQPWNQRLTVFKTRWCWSDHQWPRCLSELTVLFLHVAPSLSLLKALAHWMSVGWSQSLDRSPPSPSSSVASIQNKANFPFHQPWLFIGFEQPDPSPFSYITHDFWKLHCITNHCSSVA